MIPRLGFALLLLLATVLPAVAQPFSAITVIARGNKTRGTHTFPSTVVQTGVRGLRFTMDIADANGPIPAISCSLEGSLDGGTTWDPAGAFTRSAGPKVNDRSGNLQTTTGATFRGGVFWNDTTNPNRRLRGSATIEGNLRFELTVQPL